jgi:hypothetical protein
MTDADRFEVIKRGLTTEVVLLLMKRYGWSEEKAISEFMHSRVYECLQDEETKVWHYGPFQLAELYEDERSGDLYWPEVA